MARIKASLADVSTEFKLVEPGVHDFEITKVDEVEKEGDFVAYKIFSKVVSDGDSEGRVLMDYVHIRKPGEEIAADNIGLQTVKRYFEVTHGKEEVASWSDDDFDTDLLIGKRWRGQIAIGSYTKKGETQARQTNEIKRMEPAD